MMTIEDEVKMFGTTVTALEESEGLLVYELYGEFFIERSDIGFIKCPVDCLKALRPELYKAITFFEEDDTPRSYPFKTRKELLEETTIYPVGCYIQVKGEDMRYVADGINHFRDLTVFFDFPDHLELTTHGVRNRRQSKIK